MDKSSALASKNRQFLGLGPNSLSNMNNRDSYANSNSIFHNQMSPHESSTNQSLNFQSASCLHRQNPTQSLDQNYRTSSQTNAQPGGTSLGNFLAPKSLAQSKHSVGQNGGINNTNSIFNLPLMSGDQLQSNRQLKPIVSSKNISAGGEEKKISMFQQSTDTPNYFSKNLKKDPYRNSSQVNLKQGSARLLQPIGNEPVLPPNNGPGLDTYKNNQTELKASLASRGMGGIRQSMDSGLSPAKKTPDFLPSLGMNRGTDKTTPAGRNKRVTDTQPMKPTSKLQNDELVSKSVLDDDFNLDDF